MSDIDLPKLIAEMRALVRRQSICDVRKLGWDRVREVRVSPEDFAKLTADLPRHEGPSLVGIRVVVDRDLKPGDVIPLDERGNVISPHDRGPRCSGVGGPFCSCPGCWERRTSDDRSKDR
jgi:hypothetical protein